VSGDVVARQRAEAAVHAFAEAAHHGLTVRAGDDGVFVNALLGADTGGKGAKRQGAGYGEDGALLGEGASHDVLSMTALLCLDKLVEWHSSVSKQIDSLSARWRT
jgi:hypothetical protein